MFEATEGEPTGDSTRAAVIDTELAQVVGLARAGDGLAFRDLFQKYNGQVCTYLARLVGNDETGRDLAQETFVRAWKSLPAIRERRAFQGVVVPHRHQSRHVAPATRPAGALAALARRRDSHVPYRPQHRGAGRTNRRGGVRAIRAGAARATVPHLPVTATGRGVFTT